MGIFNDNIYIDKNGHFVYKAWVEWKHVPTGVIHCPICLKLNKCWFDKLKMPELPQHNKCHCATIEITKPNDNDIIANCPIEKFTEYIFSPKYEWNGKKKLFNALGFTIEYSYLLQKEFELQARKKYASGYYELGKLTVYGQIINIEILIIRDGLNPASFISGWMVKPKGRITNNTPLGGK